MQDGQFWRRMLREALAVLALPPDEQVRANGPGCIACDLLNDFDHARTAVLADAAEALSKEQLRTVDRINAVMDAMVADDFECFNNDVIRRPVWQQLRALAADALAAFGWDRAKVDPFTEVEPGVWHRPMSGDS